MQEIERLYLKQAAKLDRVEDDLAEARELILLLAGIAGDGRSFVVNEEERAQSVRVERVDGGVRFYINEVPTEGNNDDDDEG